MHFEDLENVAMEIANLLSNLNHNHLINSFPLMATFVVCW